MTVQKIVSKDGGAVKSNVGTYDLIATTKDIKPKPKDAELVFFNQGGYVGKYNLSYLLDGKPVSLSTGNLALGNKKNYIIPGRATNIHVKGESKTFLFWAPWKTIFDQDVTLGDICFKSYGTSLNPSFNNNCT